MSTKPLWRRRFGVGLVALAPSLGLISTNLILPVMQPLGAEGFGREVLNAAVTQFLLAFAITQMFCGFVVRRATAYPLLIAALALPVLVLVPAWMGLVEQGAVVGLRMLFGICMGFVVVACRFLMGNIADDALRKGAFALSAAAFATLPILALFIAPSLAQVGGALAIFALPIGLAIFVAIGLLLTGAPESSRSSTEDGGLQLRYLEVALSSSILYACVYGVYLWASNQVGLAQELRQTILIGAAVATVAGAASLRFFPGTENRQYRALTLLCLVSAATMNGAFYVGGAALFFVLGALMPLSLSLFLSASRSGSAVPSSVIGSLQLFGGFVGAQVVASAGIDDAADMAVLATAICLLGVVVQFAGEKALRTRQS